MEDAYEYEDDIAQTYQGSLNSIYEKRGQDSAAPMLFKVTAVYSDRMTCDLVNQSGGKLLNAPVLNKAGVVGDTIYGELDLPAVGDTVMVIFLNSRESQPVVIGTIIPYLHSYFKSAQKPIATANKSFTKKLLEAAKLNTYRRVFKSGTTLEVQDDGTVIVETPAGHYIKVPGTGNGITIQEKGGCSIVMSSTSVMINGNLEILK